MWEYLHQILKDHVSLLTIWIELQRELVSTNIFRLPDTVILKDSCKLSFENLPWHLHRLQQIFHIQQGESPQGSKVPPLYPRKFCSAFVQAHTVKNHYFPPLSWKSWQSAKIITKHKHSKVSWCHHQSSSSSTTFYCEHLGAARAEREGNWGKSLATFHQHPWSQHLVPAIHSRHL